MGESQGGWSDPGGPGEQAEPEVHDRRGSHYTELTTIGEGGMGIVLAVHDERLDRRLALKRARRPRRGLETRLEREIATLADLQHPSIVPLFDAGVDASGRPWYTMPELQGHTLERRLEDGSTLDERMRLLRPMLAACYAVAHAHERGVIHRDLKPANIFLGENGQTYVLDWGLAGRLDEPEPPTEPGGDPPSGPVDDPESVALTRAGQVMGTPGYMGPEQHRGELAGTPADVFALGVILYAIAYGRRPTLDAGVLDERAFSAGADPLAPDFLAIVRRCLDPEPRRRYPHAGALATELERFLDGRRVHAHAYTSGELLRRFIAANRVVLTLGVASLAVLLAVGWTSVQRIRRENASTRAARAEAQRALVEADDRLHQLLTSQAIAAVRLGAFPEAERLALEALALRDSPLARGVLATAATTPAKRELGERLPVCEVAELFPGAERFGCRRSGDLQIFEPGSAEPVAALPGTPEFRILDDHHLLALTDGAARVFDLDDLDTSEPIGSGGVYTTANVPGTTEAIGVQANLLLRWDDRAGSRETVHDAQIACAGEPLAHQLVAAREDSTQFWALCTNGAVERIAIGEDSTPSAATTPAMVPGAIAIAVGRERLFVATLAGEIRVLDRATLDPITTLSTSLGRLRSLAIAPLDDRLAVRDDFGRVEILDVHDAGRRLRLPGHGTQAMRFDSAGRLVLARRRWEIWTLPATLPIRVRRGQHGLSSVAMSADGRWLATADGGGFVSLWDADSGAPVWVQRWQERVAKDCAFSADSRRLACVTMDGPRIWRVPSAEPEPTPPQTLHVPARRVGWLADQVWMLPYARPVRRFVDGQLLELDGTEGNWRDLGVAPDGTALVRLDMRTGQIVRDSLGPSGPRSEAIATRPRAIAVDLGPAGEVAIAGPGSTLEVIEPDGEQRFVVEAPAEQRLLDVEVSPDGGLLAAGTLGGEIVVYDAEGTLRARLTGHESRVVKLAFASDGSHLLSASWDSTVRRWTLAPILAPLDALEDSGWPITLDDAVDGSIPLP